jgi:hypothetical protein
MAKIILNEDAQNQLTEIINQLPISHINQAQKIMKILNDSVEQEVPKEELK